MTTYISEKNLPRLFIDQDGIRPGVLVHIDPGHGGIVQGVYQTKGKMWKYEDGFTVFEGVINREIAKILATKCYNNHISYNLTTISNYDESLKDRMAYVKHVMQTYPAYKHVLLSIHCDATETESDANGITLYTTPGITESDFAANFYFPYFYELGLKVRINRAKPGEYDKEENFYVIRKAEEFGGIGLLIENGFFTNRKEAEIISNPEFHGNAANALFRGTRDLITKISKDGTAKV